MRILVVLVALLGAALVRANDHAVAQTAGRWQVWLEQDGRRMDFAGQVHLKKKPFSFVFRGPKDWGYGVVASQDKSELQDLRTKADIEKVIRPFNIGAESPDRENRWLPVNLKGLIAREANGAAIWQEDADDMKFSFQTYQVAPNGQATARREIDELLLNDGKLGSPSVKVVDYAGGEIGVLFTGLPPIGSMAHLDPKFATIVFDRR